MKNQFLTFLACVGAVAVLRADPVIQFDDLPSSLTQVPSGYHLLKYTNVFLMNGNTYPFNPSGFQAGIVSGSYVIYGGGGTTTVIAGDMFDFLSASATGAFNDNLQLEAKGYIHGTLVYDQINSLSATAPTLINYNFYGVDEVDFTSYGGTHHAGYSIVGTQFVMDNVNVKTYLPYTPQLVANGGFETGDLSGWAHSGNLTETWVTNTPAYVHSGSYGLQIGPVGSPGIISQTIPTQMQHIYDYTFFLTNGQPGGPNSFRMTIDGVLQWFETNTTLTGWEGFVGHFTASRPTANIQFQFINNPSFWGFDDFSVVDNATLEPLNAGFESGDLTYWGQSGNTNVNVVPWPWIGSYATEFACVGSPGYVGQLLHSSAGQPFLISYWLLNHVGGANEYHASWSAAFGQGPVVSLADQTNLPALDWTNLHYTVIGSSFESILQIGLRNDVSSFLLDQVSVLPVPLVQNGSFEFGDFTGWTRSGNLTDTFVSTSTNYANQGFYGAQLGPVGSLGFLSQTMPTIPGQSYLIHFEIQNPQVMNNAEFQVSWGGNVLMDVTNEGLIGWLPFEFAVTATGTNTALQFGFRDDPAYLGLDNVSVTPIPAPNIESITRTNSSADLVVDVMPKFLYQAQYTTNLSQPNWLPVGNLAFPTNFPMDLTDTNATDSQRFYRVLLKPPPLIF